MNANTASGKREISRTRAKPLRPSQNGRISHVSQGERGNQVRGTTETFFPTRAISP